MAVGVAVALASFALALVLGALYFKVRRFSTHEARLQRMLAQKPTLDQVLEGLRHDGSPLIESPADEAALRRVADRFDAGDRRDGILAKGRRWATTRVFRAGDMIYFIYFDVDGVMRDFACASA